jgi:hypothetical protein
LAAGKDAFRALYCCSVRKTSERTSDGFLLKYSKVAAIRASRILARYFASLACRAATNLVSLGVAVPALTATAAALSSAELFELLACRAATNLVSLGVAVPALTATAAALSLARYFAELACRAAATCCCLGFGEAASDEAAEAAAELVTGTSGFDFAGAMPGCFDAGIKAPALAGPATDQSSTHEYVSLDEAADEDTVSLDEEADEDIMW